MEMENDHYRKWAAAKWNAKTAGNGAWNAGTRIERLPHRGKLNDVVVDAEETSEMKNAEANANVNVMRFRVSMVPATRCSKHRCNQRRNR